MLIQITDPFLLPDGTNWTGTIIYTLLYATTLNGSTVVGAQQAIQVTDGISVQLAPGLYSVQLNQSGLREVYTAQWGVPVSGGPYTVAEISSNVSLQGSFGGVVLSGTPTTGQIPTATSPTSATWQTPTSGGLLQSNTVSISSAQLISDNPIVLVPAAGSGMVVFPFAIRAKLNFGTMAYVARDLGPYLWWGSNTGQIISASPIGISFELQINVVLSTATTASYLSGLSAGNTLTNSGGFPPSQYDNSPIVLQELPTYTLNCGPVLSAVATTPGTGYAPGDQLNPFGSQGVFGDAVLTVATVDGGGGITGLTITSAGTTNDSGSGTPQNVTGSGSGAVVNVTVQPGDGTLLVTTWYTVAPL